MNALVIYAYLIKCFGAFSKTELTKFIFGTAEIENSNFT